MKLVATSSASAAVSPRHGLHEWFARTPGRLVLEAQAEHIAQLLPDLFGYHVVQVGRVGPVNLLEHSRILHRVLVDIDGEDLTKSHASLRAGADGLPLATDSVDVLLLPHVLEFEDRPHDALREAHRVLVPEGNLLISGFNPWSMMGLGQIVRRRARSAPWRGRFIGINRIKDWMSVLGLEVSSVHTCFFRPPFARDGLMNRLQALEVAGRRAWPYLAGCYVVAARKRVIRLTPIRPRWAPRRRVVGVGLIEPSTRVEASSRVAAND